jgi:aminoglycoside 3-N-acetyltransferase
MNVTRADIVADLRRLGIGPGDLVFFHSSLKSIGWVEGGAESVIDAFLEAVGPDGTIAVPTMIHTSGYPRPLFDPATSPSEVGLITETLRRRAGAFRSLHPAESVGALGRDARWLTEGHRQAGGRWSPWDESAYGVGSPWDKLYRRNAKVLLLGVGYDVLSMGHFLEAVYYQWLREQHPHVRPLPNPSVNRHVLGARLEAAGLVALGTVGQATVKLLRAGDIVDEGMRVLQDDPLALLPAQSPCARFVRLVRDGDFILAGAGRVALTEYYGRPVWARVLALRHGETTVALVVCELMGLAGDDADRIRASIEQTCGVSRAHISVSCTHRHSAPGYWPPRPQNADLRAQLPTQLASAVQDALERMAPQMVYFGKSRLHGFVRNERLRLDDGKVVAIARRSPSTWRWKTKPEVVGFAGPTDDELGLIEFRNLDGQVTALWGTLGPHDIPDFYERAAARVEAAIGGDAVVLLSTGNEGAQDVPFEDLHFKGMTRDEIGEHLGKVLAYEILKAREQTDLMLDPSLAARTQALRIQIREDHIAWASAQGRSRFPDACARGYFDTEV